MATRNTPPRSWNIDMLLILGQREGDQGKHLRAIPVLILEKWVQGGREEEAANYILTKDVAKRSVSSKLVHPFKPKGISVIPGALARIQASRNLTRPPLIEPPRSGTGMFRVNLPYYEPLLEEYRQKFRELYPQEYERLFPEREPEWGPPNVQTDRRGAKPPGAESDVQDEIQSLLAPVEQALSDRQQAIEKLTEENQKRQADLVALQARPQERHELPHRSIVDEELRNDCAEFLNKEDTYVDAIRRAGVVLEERLKKAIGGNGPEKFKQGVELVDYALRKDTGRLSVSEHPAEQEGVHMLFRGAVQFVRNPPSHKKMRYAEVKAVKAIGLIDYLLLLLQQAKSK